MNNLERRKTDRRRRSWLFRMAAVLLGVMAASFFAEIALRFAGIGFPSFYTPDDYCGSRLRPNTRGVWITEGHGYVAVNSLGFRGAEFEPNKPAGALRIAVLGDSMIEAMQVNIEHTFCAQLQERLRSTLNSTRPIEVINCGVAGYGTAQELLMLQHYVLPLKPDLVLLSFFPQNDIRNNLLALSEEPPVPYFHIENDGQLQLDDAFRKSEAWLTARTPYEQFKAWVTNRSRVLQVIKQAKLTARSHTTSGSATIESQLQALFDEAPYAYRATEDPVHNAAIRVTGRLLQEIGRECKSHDIPLLIFSASSPLQVYPDVSFRHAIAAQNGVEDLLYADTLTKRLCDSFADSFVELATHMQRELDGQKLYYHGFANVGLGLGHWNENGHRVAARLMAESIIDRKLLRPTTSIRRSP